MTFARGLRFMQFRLWAPTPRKVELEIHTTRLPMAADAGGWWSVDVPDAEEGTQYAYRLDDGPLRSDPRSPYQPHGPGGVSQTVDHQRFAWDDHLWRPPPLSAAVLYELHVGTFTPKGTFLGVIDRLRHLRELGVTHLELMPVAEFAGERGWGYDGVNLYAPHHRYGTPDDLKRLVNACHQEGLAILLDVVYNHFGPSENYLPEFGPYLTDRYHTAWGSAVNFDGPQSDEVRRFFCDNALMWLRDYHFDGLRLDAVHAIIDTSAVPFLEQLAVEVKTLSAHVGRQLQLIAESDLNDPRLVRARSLGGCGLDCHWADDFHHALHTALAHEQAGYYLDFGSLGQLATVMKSPYLYDGSHSRFRGRRHGRPADGLWADQFVVCLQNHDQVGNRARGERIGHLINPDRVKIGAALTLLSPFVPLLFQGEEWNASSPFQYFVDFHHHPQLARAVTEGRRREFASFGWRPEEVPDPQDEETFCRSRLSWEEVSEPAHAPILSWYKQLVALRRQYPELSDPRPEQTSTQYDEAAQWLVVERGLIAIVSNLADQPQTIPVHEAHSGCIALASKLGAAIREHAVDVPAESIVVLVRDRRKISSDRWLGPGFMSGLA